MAFMDQTRDYWDMLRKKRFGSRQPPPPPSRGQFAPQAYDQMFMGTPAGQNPIGADPPVIGQAQAAGWRGPTAGSPYNTRPQQARQFMNAAPLASQNVMPDIGQTLAQARRVGSGIQTPEKKQSPGLLKRIGAATAAGGGAMSAAASRPGASFWEALGAFGPQFSDVYTENQRYLAEQEQEAREEARKVRIQERIEEDRGLDTRQRTRVDQALTAVISGLPTDKQAQARAMGIEGLEWARNEVQRQDFATSAANWWETNSEKVDPGDRALWDALPGDAQAKFIMDQEAEWENEGAAGLALASQWYGVDDISRLPQNIQDHITAISKNQGMAETLATTRPSITFFDTPNGGGELRDNRGRLLKSYLPGEEEEDPFFEGQVEAIQAQGDLYGGLHHPRVIGAYKDGIGVLHNFAPDETQLADLKAARRDARLLIGDGESAAAAAKLEMAWGEIGLPNLQFLKGSTTDREMDKMIAMEGDWEQSRDYLIEIMTRRLRNELSSMEEYNRKLFELGLDNPEKVMRDYGVQIMSDDLPGLMWTELQNRKNDPNISDEEKRWLDYLMSGPRSYIGGPQRGMFEYGYNFGERER